MNDPPGRYTQKSEIRDAASYRSLYAVWRCRHLSAALPLDEQLRALQEWYSHTRTKLLSFKTHFKSFTSSIIARADARSLQVGVEEASYEGPLHLEVHLLFPVMASLITSVVFFQLPIHRDPDDTGMLSFDVSLPSPGDDSSNEFFDSLTRALRAIHVFKKNEATRVAMGGIPFDGFAVDQSSVAW